MDFKPTPKLYEWVYEPPKWWHIKKRHVMRYAIHYHYRQVHEHRERFSHWIQDALDDFDVKYDEVIRSPKVDRPTWDSEGLVEQIYTFTFKSEEDATMFKLKYL